MSTCATCLRPIGREYDDDLDHTPAPVADAAAAETGPQWREALDDLRERLAADVQKLKDMAASLPKGDEGERARLKGKAQGVLLALSKLDETLRGMP